MRKVAIRRTLFIILTSLLTISLLIINPSAAKAEGDKGIFTQYLPLPSTGTSWHFDTPQGITTDIYGNVYVADTYDSQIQKLNSNGEVIAKWGNHGGGEGELDYVSGIAISSQGNVYVTDSTTDPDGGFTDCRVEVFGNNGGYIKEWGTYGEGDGQFERPEGIAIDSNDNVYVADYATSRIQKFDKDGNFIKKWDGDGTDTGKFEGCIGIAIDSSGYVYVTDTGNRRVEKFDCDGNFVSKWSISGVNGEANEIAADNLGYVYVAVTDQGSVSSIQKFNTSGLLISKWTRAGSSRFDCPYGIAADNFGNIYVGEALSVLKLSNKGSLHARWSNTGTQNGAFNYVGDIAFDSKGNLYVMDCNNKRVQVFDKNGKYITKFKVGTSHICPVAIAIDSKDNVYVMSDVNVMYVYDSGGHFIKKWGEWGLGGNVDSTQTNGMTFDSQDNLYIAVKENREILVFTKDGEFLRSRGDNDWSGPENVVLGPDGLLYISDARSDRVLVYDTSGNFVRKWLCHSDSDKEEHCICGIACDANGNIYTTDICNNSIQQFSSVGDLISVWGKKGIGDNRFFEPCAIKVDKTGNVFVADSANSRIMIKKAASTTGSSIDYLSLNTSPILGYVPGGSNILSMKAGITIDKEATLNAYVYNTKGKWVAQVSVTADKSGEYKFDWDGKATKGNTAKITTGKLVPSSSGGTSYKIKAFVQSEKGSSWSTVQTIKFYSSSKIKWIGITNSQISSGQKASFTFQIAHFSNVQVQILDSLGRIAALYDEGTVFPNRNLTVTWDGNATDGNGISLSSGTAVPAGIYTIKIIAGGTNYTAKTKISVY